MQSDTDLVRDIIRYMRDTPDASMEDIINNFGMKGIPVDTTLYILRELEVSE